MYEPWTIPCQNHSDCASGYCFHFHWQGRHDGSIYTTGHACSTGLLPNDWSDCTKPDMHAQVNTDYKEKLLDPTYQNKDLLYNYYYESRCHALGPPVILHQHVRPTEGTDEAAPEESGAITLSWTAAAATLAMITMF